MCIVFAVYECIVHLTFLDYATLLSQGKQVDGTEEEVLHRQSPHHLQAHLAFLTSSPNGV